MDTKRITRKAALVLLAAGTSLFPLSAARADSLTFTSTPASNAVAQMSKRYGVSIVFRGAVNNARPVTFNVDDADTPDGRLQAMNALGNALDMDFQKVFIVSKIDPGTTVPEVKVDSNGPLVFPTTKIPARDAIKAIAGVDNALVQISRTIEGNVVFPSRRMTAAMAAAVVARQTRTVWRAYYGFYKRGEEPARLKGDVVDTDINGNPVTASPLVTYRNQISTPAPLSNVQVSGDLPTPTFGNSVTSVPDINNGFSFSPYGFPGSSPYGFDYGNPYGFGGFGYPAPDGGFAFPGTVITPGGGAAPVVPGVNAPGFTPPGSTVTTTPSNSTTILPDFPIIGGGGGLVGGY